MCVCVCDKPLCHCLRPAVICFSFEFHVLIPGVVVYPVTKYTSSIAACGWGVYLSLKLQQNCDMQQKCKGCGTEVWFSNRGSRASSQTLKKKIKPVYLVGFSSQAPSLRGLIRRCYRTKHRLNVLQAVVCDCRHLRWHRFSDEFNKHCGAVK